MVQKSIIIGKFQTEGNKIIELFSSLSEDEWESLIYFDKVAWKIKDILSHFISSEQSFISLFDSIRLFGQGTPDDFSVDEFNNSQVLKMKDINKNELVELFNQTRAKTIDWLMNISDTELEKIGKHPGMGEVKLIEMVKMINLHNQVHLRDLIRTIKKQSE